LNPNNNFYTNELCNKVVHLDTLYDKLEGQGHGEENVAKVVGATSSEELLVLISANVICIYLLRQ